MYNLFILFDHVGMYSSNEKKLLTTFGKRIAELRKKRGVTQQQLAEAVGMSVVAIAYLETGKRWAKPGTLIKIAHKLNVRVEDFFKGL